MSKKHQVWLVFALSIPAYLYIIFSYEKPECERTVLASEVPQWLMSEVRHVRFDDGNWFDGNGVLIGVSATEDSDVCVK